MPRGTAFFHTTGEKSGLFPAWPTFPDATPAPTSRGVCAKLLEAQRVSYATVKHVLERRAATACTSAPTTLTQSDPSIRPVGEYQAFWEDHSQLTDVVVVTPLLDRLMHHGHLLRFDGKSWRLKESAARLAKRAQTA